MLKYYTYDTLELRISSESFRADADWAVLYDTALGIRSTNTHTVNAWIFALLLDASLILRTIRIDFAFWFDDGFNDGSNSTLDKRISSIAERTRADRIVADNLTTSIDTACTRTRIATFLSDTSQTVDAVGVCGALRFAGNVRVSKESRQTDANTSVVLRTAFSIRTAWVRIANINAIDRARHGDDWDWRTE